MKLLDFGKHILVYFNISLVAIIVNGVYVKPKTIIVYVKILTGMFRKFIFNIA